MKITPVYKVVSADFPARLHSSNLSNTIRKDMYNRTFNGLLDVLRYKPNVWRSPIVAGTKLFALNRVPEFISRHEECWLAEGVSVITPQYIPSNSCPDSIEGIIEVWNSDWRTEILPQWNGLVLCTKIRLIERVK